MKIASYYQQLLEASLTAAAAMEPISFVGMYDSGIDYVFGLALPLLKKKLTDRSIVTDETMVEAELKKKPVLLVQYFDQDKKNDLSIFPFINRMRLTYGWSFSYVLFASTRILKEQEAIVKKVLTRNLVPVLPLSEKDSMVVLHNYEVRYDKKLQSGQEKQVMTLAGGNPGLIKALYLQIIGSTYWRNPDLADEQLAFRLKGIRDDMPSDTILKKYGYDKIPLLAKIKEPNVSPYLLTFSKSQRKVIDYLKIRAGQLVTKDDIAGVLWGENWADKYSDWAIDQLISTLREKLASVDKKAKIISKRGEGMIYIP